MKKILLIAIICATGSFAFAQKDDHSGHNHGATQETSKATVDGIQIKEREFDFGKIPQGKPVTHTFEVVNSSNASYKIDHVQASCGCTTPVWDKDKTLAPGEKSIITVGYNAAAEGPFTKTITVTYNVNQNSAFQIKGEVWKTPASSAPANESLNDLN